MNSLKNFFGFFFGFKGRIGRLHFAIFLLLMIPLNFIIATIMPTVLDIIFHAIRTNQLGYALLSILFGVGLITLWLGLKYSHLVRRANDYNVSGFKSGLVITIFILDLTSFYFLFIQNWFTKELFSLTLNISQLVCLSYMLFSKGSIGENDFGKPQVPFWKKTNS